jgi:hypothetical protein
MLDMVEKLDVEGTSYMMGNFTYHGGNFRHGVLLNQGVARARPYFQNLTVDIRGNILK